MGNIENPIGDELAEDGTPFLSVKLAADAEGGKPVVTQALRLLVLHPMQYIDEMSDAESLSGAKRTALETFSRLVVLGVAFCLIWFGYLNFLDGFRSLRMPSMTPLASLYAGIPFCGVLVALFTLEQLVNGWQHGFEDRA